MNNNKNLHLYTKQQRLYAEVYNKKVYKCFQGRHSIHKYTGQRENRQYYVILRYILLQYIQNYKPVVGFYII